MNYHSFVHHPSLPITFKLFSSIKLDASGSLNPIPRHTLTYMVNEFSGNCEWQSKEQREIRRLGNCVCVKKSLTQSGRKDSRYLDRNERTHTETTIMAREEKQSKHPIRSFLHARMFG